MAKNIKVTINRRSVLDPKLCTLPAGYIHDCGSPQSNRGGIYFTDHKKYPLIAKFTPFIGAGYPVDPLGLRGAFYLVFKADPASYKNAFLHTCVQTGQDDGGFYFNTIPPSSGSPALVEADPAGKTLLTTGFCLADGVRITLENYTEPRFEQKF
jgi:hypothetical protein